MAAESVDDVIAGPIGVIVMNDTPFLSDESRRKFYAALERERARYTARERERDGLGLPAWGYGDRVALLKVAEDLRKEADIVRGLFTDDYDDVGDNATTDRLNAQAAEIRRIAEGK